MKTTMLLVSSLLGFCSLASVLAIDNSAAVAPRPANLAMRQTTRGQILARIKRGKRQLGPSAVPVVLGPCGTVTGQRFLVRATTPATGAYPDTAPGFLSGTGRGEYSIGLAYLVVTTDITAAEVYTLDEANSCELTSITQPDSLVRAYLAAAQDGGAAAVEGTDQAAASSGLPLTSYQCQASAGVLSCSLSNAAIINQEYNSVQNGADSPKIGEVATCDPVASTNGCGFPAESTLTLTLIPTSV